MLYYDYCMQIPFAIIIFPRLFAISRIRYENAPDSVNFAKPDSCAPRKRAGYPDGYFVEDEGGMN